MLIESLAADVRGEAKSVKRIVDLVATVVTALRGVLTVLVAITGLTSLGDGGITRQVTGSSAVAGASRPLAVP